MIRNLFCLKDKNQHPACKICEGTCSCSADYIAETKRNVKTGWNKHENPNKDSEPVKPPRGSPGHLKFNWKTLLTAPTTLKLHKILESSIIALKKPSLNEQLNSNQLILFRNGVTWLFYYLIKELKLTNTYVFFCEFTNLSSVTKFYCFNFRRFNYCISFVT